jgi:hypothetical protein
MISGVGTAVTGEGSGIPDGPAGTIVAQPSTTAQARTRRAVLTGGI